MKYLVIFLILSITFSSGLTGNVYACSCAILTEQEALEYSQSSFIGIPIKIESPSDYTRLVTFQIEKSIKNISENKTLITVRTSPQDSACGYNFDTSTRYLVHTYFVNDPKILETGLCSGNKNLGVSILSDTVVSTYDPYSGGLGISFFNEPLLMISIILLELVIGIGLYLGLIFYWRKRKRKLNI